MTQDIFHIEEDDDYSNIRLILKNIAELLVTKGCASCDDLMVGKAGIVLFLAYYGLYFDVSYLLYVQEFTDGIIDSIEETNDISFSYAEGLLGISSLFCHLAEKKIINQNYLSDEVYSFLSNYTLREIDRWNDEFLYGAGGGIAFFLQDYQYTHNTQSYYRLQEFSERIFHRNKIFNNILPESSPTGIAHGYSSWLILLPKLISLNICQDSNELILDGILRKYEAFLYSNYSSFGYYPRTIDNEGNATTYWNRFGWCRGDISCLIAQLQCYMMRKDEYNTETALNKLIQLSRERDAERYHVHDSAICHGSSGLFLIYNWLYTISSNDIFKEARDFWLKKTLSVIDFNDTYLGFRKRYYKGEKEILSQEIGFLEGIAGIGLSLMASIGINDDWKKLLLIGIS